MRTAPVELTIVSAAERDDPTPRDFDDQTGGSEMTDLDRPTSARTTAAPPSDAAVGWTVFAAIMMTLQGIWWTIAGLVALFNDEFYVVGQEYIFQFDVTSWGWIHLIVGVVLIAASVGLYSGAMWARITGVIMASIAMIVAFAWLPWYPIWALMFIGASVAVIWALTAHGRDITRAM
jgi:hypothetical protein